MKERKERQREKREREKRGRECIFTPAGAIWLKHLIWKRTETRVKTRLKKEDEKEKEKEREREREKEKERNETSLFFSLSLILCFSLYFSLCFSLSLSLCLSIPLHPPPLSLSLFLSFSPLLAESEDNLTSFTQLLISKRHSCSQNRTETFFFMLLLKILYT